MIGARSPQPDFVEPVSEPRAVLLPVAPAATPAKAERTGVIVVGAIAFAALLVGLTASTLMSPDEASAGRIAVAGFAEDFVFTFLASAGENSEELLRPFLGYSPDLNGMVSGNFYVTQVTARDVRGGDGSWDVMVRADYLARAAGGFTRADALHFAVRIVADPGSGLRAAALPAPSVGSMVPAVSTQPEESLPADGVAVAAVEAYLDWYLTESAPVNGVVPVGSFSEVHLVSLDTDADTAHAGVVATTATGHKLRFDIPLTKEGGSWEVLDFNRESR